ncbi:MAG: DUF695 domain-containing protein [Desulfobacterales bacterium]|nr:DUF695 domain-containing protein [Desulfobacterales bacterium]
MDLADIIARDKWAGAEGTHNELPLIIRFRNEVSRDCDLEELPQLIRIFWTFEDSPSGMPSSAESDAMRIFEDRLIDALEPDLSGMLIAAITTNGYREWVYYVRSVEAFSEKLHTMPQEEDPYPIEIQTRNDPEWGYFFNNVKPEG